MENQKTTIPRKVLEIAHLYGNAPAQYKKNENGTFEPTSYSRLVEEMFIVAAGFKHLGISKGSLVGLVSENRKEWLLTDLGLLALGAADVPRGCDTMAGELVYILKTVQAPIAVFENPAQFNKIVPHLAELPELKTVILYDMPEDINRNESGIHLYSFAELFSLGQKHLQENRDEIQKSIDTANPNDLATIIFTSGTTGQPKGVMLSHWNFLTQALFIENKISINQTDIWLCVLPVWHSFERVMQYISLSWGCSLAYSKPIGRIMLADFASIRPTWMASVPRIWESLRAGIFQKIQSEGGAKWALFQFFVKVGKAHTYQKAKLRGFVPRFTKRNRVLDGLTAFIPWLLLTPLAALGSVLVFKKIRQKLGGRFIAGISGGGALPSHVDDFFAAAGILLLEGYGLTETGPVISVRTQWKPVLNTIGSPLQFTEAQVRSEEGEILSPGEIGILWVRGPQRMLGYYQQPEQTANILDKDDWLNTGDLAMMTWDDEIAIRGRAKDTIVLLGGENIEPAPMEAKIRDSIYIDQAMIVGQDQKMLGSILVPNPEALHAWAQEQGLTTDDWTNLCASQEVHNLLRNEVNQAISSKNGFRTWEQISKILVVSKAFEVGNELSGKQDLKRHVITDMYKNEILNLFQ